MLGRETVAPASSTASQGKGDGADDWTLEQILESTEIAKRATREVEKKAATALLLREAAAAREKEQIREAEKRLSEKKATAEKKAQEMERHMASDYELWKAEVAAAEREKDMEQYKATCELELRMLPKK